MNRNDYLILGAGYTGQRVAQMLLERGDAGSPEPSGRGRRHGAPA